MLGPQPRFNQIGSAHPGASFGSCQQAFRREDRMASVGQVIVWIVIGLIGGTLAGILIKGDRHGFGTMNNLGLGLLGALTGGFLFRALGCLYATSSPLSSVRCSSWCCSGTGTARRVLDDLDAGLGPSSAR
jgi:uncharacterized membrane protein YeaQ/YmgE (transglycosylase-associated protein family)